MSLRRLPPVCSPLSGPALCAGLGAAVSSGAASRAHSAVERWIGETFAPQGHLLTDSGTSALTLALSLAAPGGGRVALPAWGCYDLATACDGAGVEVVLYDLDPITLAPDWTSLRAALVRGVAAAVVVHFYGLPVVVAEVAALAREQGAVIIEDAAQGAGASVSGRPCGALGGEFAVLSFGRGKGITGGRGGALLGYGSQWATAVEEAASRFSTASRGWMELPKSLIQHLLARPSLYGIPASLPFLRLGETLYHPPHPVGRLPRAAAGILSLTIGLAAAEADRRRANAARLLVALGNATGLRAATPVPGAVAGFLRLPVIGVAMGPRLLADPSAQALGIMPGYPGTLAELGGFSDRVINRAADFPGARELAARLGTLPTHGRLNEADLRRLEGWLLAARAA